MDENKIGPAQPVAPTTVVAEPTDTAKQTAEAMPAEASPDSSEEQKQSDEAKTDLAASITKNASNPGPMLGKAACSIFGIIVGIWGWFQSTNLSTGSSEYDSSYGGDAYTGIQNAAAQTATNVHLSNEYFAVVLSVLSLAVIAYFGVKLFEAIEEYLEGNR